jgi:hypothetical protein
MADPLALLMAERVSAKAQHFCGNHATARIYAERVLDHPAKGIPLAYMPVQVDRQVSMRIVLARILWLEGNAEQALALVKETLELASADSPFAQCQALALAACPIALWCGEQERAQEHVTALMRESGRYRLDFWRSYGEWFQRAVDLECVTSMGLESEARRRENALSRPSSGLLLDTMLTINPAVMALDLAGIDGTKTSGWSAPEKLRILGQHILGTAPPEASARAEMFFLRAIEAAEQQNALAWNLRACMSLGKLWSQEDRKRDAFGLLNGVYRRFSEGFETTDMREAVALLDRFA